MGAWVGVEATGMEFPETYKKQGLVIGFRREGQRNK